jgi:hypothetical protein
MLCGFYVAYHLGVIMGRMIGHPPFQLVRQHLLFLFYCIYFILCTSFDHMYYYLIA